MLRRSMGNVQNYIADFYKILISLLSADIAFFKFDLK